MVEGLYLFWDGHCSSRTVVCSLPSCIGVLIVQRPSARLRVPFLALCLEA